MSRTNRHKPHHYYRRIHMMNELKNIQNLNDELNEVSLPRGSNQSVRITKRLNEYLYNDGCVVSAKKECWKYWNDVS